MFPIQRQGRKKKQKNSGTLINNQVSVLHHKPAAQPLMMSGDAYSGPGCGTACCHLNSLDNTGDQLAEIPECLSPNSRTKEYPGTKSPGRFKTKGPSCSLPCLLASQRSFPAGDAKGQHLPTSTSGAWTGLDLPVGSFFLLMRATFVKLLMEIS